MAEICRIVIYGDGLCSLLSFMFLSLLFSCASQSGSYQLSVTCHPCPCCMLSHSDSFHRTLAPKIRPQIPLKNCRQTESYDHSFCPLVHEIGRSPCKQRRWKGGSRVSFPCVWKDRLGFSSWWWYWWVCPMCPKKTKFLLECWDRACLVGM